MNIDELTIGEAKEIASNLGRMAQGDAAKAGTAQGLPSKPHLMLGKHCVVRTYSDGVHVGVISYACGTEALVTNSRRVYSWRGAFTLSEVATTGVDSDSRLAVEVPEVYLTQVISLTPTTQAARDTYDKCLSNN